MSLAALPTGPASSNGVPLLENGARMRQPEFHRRYCESSGKAKIELIGGVVFVASPLSWPHALYHDELGYLLGTYCRATPGTELGHDATAILGEQSEPRPDLLLRVIAECGGRSQVNAQKYVSGPPELLAEIAYSSLSIDLNQKRIDYEQAGVLEYLVLSIEDEQLFWFHFPSGNAITANRRGVSRSLVFPGLWIHVPGLFARDSERSQQVLQQGLNSPAHRAFVRQLERTQRQS